MSESRILFENGYARVVEAKHGYFLYNKNDLYVGRSLENFGEWCEAGLEFLLQCIEPGDVVLDIGAHIGTHTVPFANRVGVTGCVYAFEPQRIVFQYLCTNVSLNKITNVPCLNKGVGSHHGYVNLPPLNPDAEQNFGAVNIEEFSEGDIIEVMTIDSLKLERCKLIKIDVEGMETNVLDGATKTINRLRPLLFVENNTEDNSREIINIVSNFGYKSWWVIENYFNPNNYFGNSENLFTKTQPQADMFCAPNEVEASIGGLQPVLDANDNWKKAAERIVSNNS